MNPFKYKETLNKLLELEKQAKVIYIAETGEQEKRLDINGVNIIYKIRDDILKIDLSYLKDTVLTNTCSYTYNKKEKKFTKYEERFFVYDTNEQYYTLEFIIGRLKELYNL